MAKTDPDTLSRLITPELITYLGAGQVNSDRLAQSMAYADLNIERFDDLKQLHFVLFSDVRDYIEALHQRLRRIKTVHQRTEVTTHGEVRGPVMWERTLQDRPATGDPALFVISNPEIAFDIPENRVVKKVLGTIAEGLSRDILGSEAPWRERWEDTDIVELQRTLHHNVYLDQLPEPAEIDVTDRDLTKARRSRHELYTEGARLYRLWDDLRNDRYDREDVQRLLRETIIVPTYDATVFELFCVFAEIKRLQADHAGLTLKRIESHMDELALLDGDEIRIEIYWDQGGPLKFFTEAYTPEQLTEEWEVPRPIVRQAEVLEHHTALVEQFLATEKNHSFYAGRPDIVILTFEKEPDGSRLTSVELGEVKYRETPAGFSTGLRELLEYLYFAELNDEYLFGEVLGEGAIQGTLFTDGVEVRASSVGNIQHRTTTDLRAVFETAFVT